MVIFFSISDERSNLYVNIIVKSWHFVLRYGGGSLGGFLRERSVESDWIFLGADFLLFIRKCGPVSLLSKTQGGDGSWGKGGHLRKKGSGGGETALD